MVKVWIKGCNLQSRIDRVRFLFLIINFTLPPYYLAVPGISELHFFLTRSVSLAKLKIVQVCRSRSSSRDHTFHLTLLRLGFRIAHRSNYLLSSGEKDCWLASCFLCHQWHLLLCFGALCTGETDSPVVTI